MTGFSASWLELREPADHHARNADLLARLASMFAHRQNIFVLDLGSGSGSNLRGMSASLPARQDWRLVDYDRALIDAAKVALQRWADKSDMHGEALALAKGQNTIGVSFQQADLSADLGSPLSGPIDLVTAAAFFDLVSAAWIERFVDRLAALRLPLYTVLIYDGSESWVPAHEADAAINEAFNSHQQTDKGFGAACGPAAAAVLAQALRQRGYDVITGPSPWLLTHDDLSLIAPLADGIADAARETGRVTPAEVQAWRDAHRAPASCTIGHTDLLAIPPAS